MYKHKWGKKGRKLSNKQRLILFFWIQMGIDSISEALIFGLTLFPVI